MNKIVQYIERNVAQWYENHGERIIAVMRDKSSFFLKPVP